MKTDGRRHGLPVLSGCGAVAEDFNFASSCRCDLEALFRSVSKIKHSFHLYYYILAV